LRMEGPAPRIIEVPAPPSEEKILEMAEGTDRGEGGKGNGKAPSPGGQEEVGG